MGKLELRKIKMFQEMMEQPAILRRIWDNRLAISNLVQTFPRPRFVFFTAFGSSYNAALYGQLLLYRFLGIPSLAKTPGFFLQTPKKFPLSDSLAIAISQSGEVQEVIEATKFFKKKGCRTLAVTNHPDSPLAGNCHAVLSLQAGEERSVPATKTFTATIFSLQLLIGFLGAKALLAPLPSIPKICAEILEEKNRWTRLVEKLSRIRRAFLLSPASLKAIALEGQLKLHECGQLMVEALDWSEFFHGPVSLAEKETPVFFLSSETSGRELSANRVRQRFEKWKIRAYPVPFSSSKSLDDDFFSLAVPYSVILQMLALFVAQRKGLNPDHPRHLQKITQTPFPAH